MQALGSINWWAVLVAAVATFALGGVWYGPLFGKIWMAASGMTAEKAKQGSAGLIFGLSFVCEFIAAAVLAMFIGPSATFVFGLSAGLAVGLAWVGSGLAVLYLFEHRPLAHWVVNAGYHAVAFGIMGAILGAWR